MKILDDEINEIKKNIENLSFSEILRQSRDKIGLIQYRTAQFLGFGINRLKNLETGHFRAMPGWEEIESICKFFELPKDIMTRKAEEHIKSRKETLNRTVRAYEKR